MAKHVAFSSTEDEMGEPSVDFYLYDYCDSQSVVSEAPSIDLSLLKEQQQRKMKGSDEKGMGKLLKRSSVSKRSSITSEISHDMSTAENSFWDNEENSFADYGQFGNQKGGGNGGKRSQQQRPSISSDSGGSFWNSEENSFADYMQFGGQNMERRNSASNRSGSIRLSELNFDDEGSLADSVLSMGSFALEGSYEIMGFEQLDDIEEQDSAKYRAPSKAAMMMDSSSQDSWSITESILKDGEEDLRDSMPNNRRAERRAQRARDRVSAYSSTPSRNGSIGSISVPRRNGSLGKYSDHSLGSISLSTGPRRNGSLGKYSDHSLGSSGVPRRSGSLGKYSDHSGRPSRRPVANPRRNGSNDSLGGPIRSNSAHIAVTQNTLSTSNHNPRRSVNNNNNGPRRNGSLGKAQSARVLGSAKLDSTNTTPKAPDNNNDKTEDGSPTVRQRNGMGANTTNNEEVATGSSASKPSSGNTDKVLGSSGTGGKAAAAALLKEKKGKTAALLKEKKGKIKTGKDSDNLPRSAKTRQQLLG